MRFWTKKNIFYVFLQKIRRRRKKREKVSILETNPFFKALFLVPILEPKSPKMRPRNRLIFECFAEGVWRVTFGTKLGPRAQNWVKNSRFLSQNRSEMGSGCFLFFCLICLVKLLCFFCFLFFFPFLLFLQEVLPSMVFMDDSAHSDFAGTFFSRTSLQLSLQNFHGFSYKFW